MSARDFEANGLTIRAACAADGEALTRLIEDAMGEGCFDTAHVDQRYGWVCECEGGELYERAGYTCLVQVPDFYREWSFETSTVCPACGEPPCTCEARVYLKPAAVLSSTP